MLVTLLQYTALCHGQVNLLRVDIADNAAHRGGFHIELAQDSRSGFDAVWFAGQPEAVVAAADFGAEAALKQFDVIIEGTAEALQTLIFGGFEENFLCCYL